MDAFRETLVVVNRQNPATDQLELLVGAQQRGPWRDHFNFPGGKVDEDETDIEAAIREVFEETGLEFTEADLSWLGLIQVINQNRTPERRGIVNVYGADLTADRPIRSKPDEFDCLWIDPKQRNILLNMPHDVGYWLPAVFQTPRYPFTCIKTVLRGGAIEHQTSLAVPHMDPIPIREFSRNL